MFGNISSVLLVLLVMGAGAVLAQNYPSRPIRIITSDPGGGNDVIARLIVQGVTSSGNLGQPIIVENRGGASGAIPAEAVARSTPDGHTLLVYSNNFWTLPFIQKVSYDPVKDFSPISLATAAPNVLVVTPALPPKSVKELIAYAKANPGALNFISAGLGSSPHLAGELFNIMAGVKMVHVRYKNTALAITDLIGGRVEMFFSTAQGATAHIKAGRLRALAVTSSEPSALFPGLPTVAATLPGFEAGSWVGVYAPARTPAAAMARLNQEIVRAMRREDTREKATAMGVEALGTSPAEFASVMKSDMARMGKVIREAGIRAD
jgi:tripartite-type tricarboxylate transporter receptor subunit TctC